LWRKQWSLLLLLLLRIRVGRIVAEYARVKVFHDSDCRELFLVGIFMFTFNIGCCCDAGP
jgi:hypothetical protein